MSKLIQKSIRFPAKAVEVIDREVTRTLGIDFNEYLKNVVINTAASIQNASQITPELQAQIDEAKEEVAVGKRPILHTMKDVRAHFRSLISEYA